MSNSIPLLSLEKVSKYYDELCVANKISFEIMEGELVGIIGPNGAGKTTLFNLIAGTIRADEGSIKYGLIDITKMAPSQRCQLGIGRTFQIPKTFNEMTVYENVLVGANSRRLSVEEFKDEAHYTLSICGLTDKANTLAKNLSVIKRKALGLACALSTDPELLLLDEVAGGLTDQELQDFILIVDKIRESGKTIVWIEHAVQALAAYVERLIVINFGEMIADGNPQAILDDKTIKEIYLGVEE